MSNNTDLLQPPPKRARGVRRLNNWPTWIAGGMIGVAVAATGWNYEHRAAQTQKGTERANKDPLPSDGTSLDSLIRDHNVQPVIAAPQFTPTPAPVLQKPEVQAAPNSQPGTDAAEQARRRARLADYANQAQVEQARFSAEKTALAADTAIGNGQATSPRCFGAELLARQSGSGRRPRSYRPQGMERCFRPALRVCQLASATPLRSLMSPVRGRSRRL